MGTRPMNGAPHFWVLEAAEGGYINLAKTLVQISWVSASWRLVVSRAVLGTPTCSINVPKFKPTFRRRSRGRSRHVWDSVGECRSCVHHGVPRPKQFSEALVDIYQIRFRTSPSWMPWWEWKETGPSGKDLRPIGKILASRNGVSLDGLMAAMMGILPRKVDHLDIAQPEGVR